MEFITKKLDFSNQTIQEMKINSNKFYNCIKTRRSVRDFKKDIIDFKVIKNFYSFNIFGVSFEYYNFFL